MISKMLSRREDSKWKNYMRDIIICTFQNKGSMIKKRTLPIKDFSKVYNTDD